jgi:hypothetical protein
LYEWVGWCWLVFVVFIIISGFGGKRGDNNSASDELCIVVQCMPACEMGQIEIETRQRQASGVMALEKW